jgi:predicted CoA-substrate-specific enzyme activase
LIPMAGDSRKQQRSIYAGCDLGICSAKVVITDNGAILASETVPYKCFPHDAAEAAMEGALRRAGLPGGAVVPCLATGFGDKAVRFADGAAPNINCLLRGLRALNPQVRTVIDVGGHTLRVSNITSDGELYHTAFIEECAAATGLFIETIARVLEFPLEQLSAASLTSEHPIPITNTCVVFAESEVVSYINEGYSRYDVFAGVTLGVAAKISSMARRIDIFPEVAMVGGVARNAAVKREVEQHLGLRFADLGGVDPQVVAAFGAALLAGEGYLAGAKQGRGGA